MTRVRTHIVAKTAYERVNARRGDERKKEYGVLAHRLPSMILENGLVHSTGFLVAKGEPEHQALLEDISTILRTVGVTDAPDGPSLHREIVESNVKQTLILTRRSLEASSWVKRYVQGVLRINATGASSVDTDRGN